MKPIPKKLKAILDNDPFMEKCCLCLPDEQKTRTERHHAIIYGGSQLDQFPKGHFHAWSIVPLCYKHHHQDTKALKKAKLIALNRATDEDLKLISKLEDYIDLRDRMNTEKVS